MEEERQGQQMEEAKVNLRRSYSSTTQSPESDHLPPPTCNGSAKPSIDEIDMYECKI